MVLELMDDGNVLAVELVKLTPSQLSLTLLFIFNDLLATGLILVVRFNATEKLGIIVSSSF